MLSEYVRVWYTANFCETWYILNYKSLASDYAFHLLWLRDQ